MERIAKSILFIKISAFILLTGICHFKNDVNTFNKSINKGYTLGRKLDIKTFRLLAKCKQNKDSNILELKQNIQNNTKCKKKDISINEKGDKDKNNKYNKSSLNKAQYYTEVIDYNNGMFDGKHFHFEKKWIRKKDYDLFIQKNRRIIDINLKKIKFRNYGFGVALFFLFFILGIGIPILPAINPLNEVWKSLDSNTSWKEWKEAIDGFVNYLGDYAFTILFTVFIVILSVILIIAIYRILRNNEKYTKMKLIME
ncbi:fam-m protein [Plasmodium malariae]|uniref:Fam-m protein n=1 Tax=Plasmodium malariae TaxID=5858 RepID=A0A1D3TDQ4_PLAMA|nr:fam-m protein [Plasmodium malariae]SCP03071.1 fam-m protein [Plasmodium malariae]